MTLTIDITVTPTHQSSHKDKEIAGRYQVSFEPAGENLGAQAMTVLMNNLPISQPECFEFVIQDQHGNVLSDDGENFDNLSGSTVMHDLQIQ